MRHRRCFSNTSSEKILSLLLGLKFYGLGGLFVDSTADFEEDSPDGRSRFIKNFRPLGDSFISALAGSFMRVIISYSTLSSTENLPSKKPTDLPNHSRPASVNGFSVGFCNNL